MNILFIVLLIYLLGMVVAWFCIADIPNPSLIMLKQHWTDNKDAYQLIFTIIASIVIMIILTIFCSYVGPK